MHALPRLRATIAASPVIPPRVVTIDGSKGEIWQGDA